VNIATILFWLLAGYALISRLEIVYYLAFASWSFGTLAVLPASLGVNITPPWVFAAIVVVRVIQQSSPAELAAAAMQPRAFLWLTLCTIYGLASATLFPSLFAGRIPVVLMRLSADVRGATFLEPSAANITQTAYFLITTLFAIAIFVTARSVDGRRMLFSAFKWGAVTAIITGLLDVATSSTGLSWLLAPFRNATYAIMIDDSMLGTKRVIGLVSEASAYAGLVLSFLCVIAFLPPRSRSVPAGRVQAATLTAALVAMTYLSTSSGGLLALAVVAMLVAANFVRGTISGNRHAPFGLYMVLIAVTGSVGTILFLPQIADSVSRLIDVMVLQKTHSESYIERSQWNTVAYDAFLQSYGLGVGLGGTRASSWLLAVLSNIGAPGAILLSVVVLQVMFARAAEAAEHELLGALKFALIPGLLVPSLSGTSVGFGLGNAFIVGVALAVTQPDFRPGPKTRRQGSGAPAPTIEDTVASPAGLT
jgi:hypothetical protein